MPVGIHNVPTNIISGFLGVGKTTAILDLFSKKPDTEKWAVLVNEFGKVGIDGHIYQSNDIAVKEIPGGCMCCAQGLPLQVAVNRLLRETRPDRLLIESSGVGHPTGVLNTLKGEGFNNVLTLRAGICLVDPEHLINTDYQQNELFNEQIQYADVLIANKTDLATVEALEAFHKIANSFEPAKAHVATTTNGQLNINWLDYNHQLHTQKFSLTSISPELSRNGQTQHWQTHTFHFSGNTRFSIDALRHWLNTINVIRLKGLIQTSDGCYLLNYSAGQVGLTRIDHHHYDQIENSYIEVIDLNLNITSLESGISDCIVS